MKKAASAKRYTKWQAATLFTVILISVVALCVVLVNSGAKNRVASSSSSDTRLLMSAPPRESPKTEVDPFLPASSKPRATGPRTLANAYSSAESLSKRFLAALASKDGE